MTASKIVERSLAGIAGIVLLVLYKCNVTTSLFDRQRESIRYASLIQKWQQLATSSPHAFTTSNEVVHLMSQTRNHQHHYVTADDIVFIVMASAAEKQRVACQRASWMRWAKHIYVFADEADADLGIMTLPDIENKTGFAEAQWRQLHGMKWIRQNKLEMAAKKWFFLVDDDTWVNVPHLCSYLSQFPSSLTLSFSHIYIMYDRQAVYNGGAGMLFSRPAFALLSDAVLTDRCSLLAVDSNFMNNDNILAACAFSTGVLKVSSSKFSTYEGVSHLENAIVDTSWLDQITVHKIRDKQLAVRMYCWSAILHGSRLEQECSSISEDLL